MSGRGCGMQEAAEGKAAATPEEPEWGFSPLETVEKHHFYNAVGRTGIVYGKDFQMVRRTNIAPDTSAELRWARGDQHHAGS